jgi:hypothetical protein
LIVDIMVWPLQSFALIHRSHSMVAYHSDKRILLLCHERRKPEACRLCKWLPRSCYSLSHIVSVLIANVDEFSGHVVFHPFTHSVTQA